MIFSVKYDLLGNIIKMVEMQLKEMIEKNCKIKQKYSI